MAEPADWVRDFEHENRPRFDPKDNWDITDEGRDLVERLSLSPQVSKDSMVQATLTLTLVYLRGLDNMPGLNKKAWEEALIEVFRESPRLQTGQFVRSARKIFDQMVLKGYVTKSTPEDLPSAFKDFRMYE